MKLLCISALIFFLTSTLFSQTNESREIILTVLDEDTHEAIDSAGIIVSDIPEILYTHSDGIRKINILGQSRIYYSITKNKYEASNGFANYSTLLKSNNNIPPVFLRKIPKHNYLIKGFVEDCNGNGLEGVPMFYNIGKIGDTVLTQTHGFYQIEVDREKIGLFQSSMPSELIIYYKDECKEKKSGVKIGFEGEVITQDFIKTCKCAEKKYTIKGKARDVNKIENAVITAKGEVYRSNSVLPIDSFKVDSHGLFQLYNLKLSENLFIRAKAKGYWPGTTQVKSVDSLDLFRYINFDKHRCIDFNHIPISSGIEVGGTVSLLLGIGSFVWANNIYIDYSNNIYETDFKKIRPRFSNRENAYATLEHYRKISAWLIPIGAVLWTSNLLLVRKKEICKEEQRLDREFDLERKRISFYIDGLNIHLAYQMN